MVGNAAVDVEGGVEIMSAMLSNRKRTGSRKKGALPHPLYFTKEAIKVRSLWNGVLSDSKYDEVEKVYLGSSLK